MDDQRLGSHDTVEDRDFPAHEEPRMEAPPSIGTDERRMHVRAYNYWVSLLDGRDYPSVEDLQPETIDDFGPHSVLLDFTAGSENPAIPFIGSALRQEGGHEGDIRTIADVPPRSLLSRLTDHYLQIIANRAPIGFEAEFVNHRGNATLYRGILMPFSSDDDTIDFIYGVINWKVVATEQLPEDIIAAVDSALAAPAAPAPAPGQIWADGPSAERLTQDEDAESFDDAAEDDDYAIAARVDADPELDPDAGLYDRLAAARETAETLKAADGRSRAALYRALGLAYDFALVAEARPAEYSELLDDQGLKAQARAPMTPVVKLVFGVDYDKTRLTEFAAALAHGRRIGLGVGMFRTFIERHDGGLKGIVAAERRERSPAPRRATEDAVRDALRQAPALASVAIQAAPEEEFVLLVARREEDGTLSVITPVGRDSALLDRALRRLAR